MGWLPPEFPPGNPADVALELAAIWRGTRNVEHVRPSEYRRAFAATFFSKGHDCCMLAVKAYLRDAVTKWPQVWPGPRTELAADIAYICDTWKPTVIEESTPVRRT